MLALSREDGNSSTKLSQYATERPHIDSSGVRDSQNYLRGAVESRLNIGVNSLIREAGRAEINNLNSRFLRALK